MFDVIIVSHMLIVRLFMSPPAPGGVSPQKGWTGICSCVDVFYVACSCESDTRRAVLQYRILLDRKRKWANESQRAERVHRRAHVHTQTHTNGYQSIVVVQILVIATVKDIQVQASGFSGIRATPKAPYG